ncbi:MAG: hypothetical protein LBU66_02430, partial [Treponema sp.]|nr:hypothetical protein [Treponema sp.]
MSSYYYFLSQLPYLNLEQKPPMSSSEFMTLAQSLMSKEDAAFLERLSIGSSDVSSDASSDTSVAGGYAESLPSTGCDFIDGWREWERALRLNIAKQRAILLKKDSSSVIEPPCVPADAASAAYKAVTGDGSPLDSEFLIDKARWNAIETLAGIGYFDRNQAFAYFLKLLLLERRQSFNID